MMENKRPMKTRKIFASIVAAAVAIAAAAWIAAPVGPLRTTPRNLVTFATWNMEWFPSGWPEPQPEQDELERIAKAARALRAQGVPDVLVAEEIRDEKTCRTFLKKLGGKLDLAVCSDFWFNPTNRSLQQIAIFSRYPVLASGFENWTAGDFVFPPRGFAWTVLDIRGEKVAVFGVHLKSNYIPEGKDEARQTVLNRLKREFSARQLASRALQIAATNGWNIGKILIAGDFNTSAQDPRFEKEKTIPMLFDAGFRDAFDGIPESDRPTLPASDLYPAATFDHIFVRGLDLPPMRRTGAFTDISDHAPLYASWLLGEEQSP
jgi:endonuclease/exonuclease/phosphatase family metal-dependent hydrolase